MNHVCCEMLRGDSWGAYHQHKCGKKAKVQDENGQWFCGIHSPEAKAKRKAKRDASYTKWEEEFKSKQADIYRREVCYTACEGISTNALESGVVKELLWALKAPGSLTEEKRIALIAKAEGD